MKADVSCFTLLTQADWNLALGEAAPLFHIEQSRYPGRGGAWQPLGGVQHRSGSTRVT